MSSDSPAWKTWRAKAVKTCKCTRRLERTKTRVIYRNVLQMIKVVQVWDQSYWTTKMANLCPTRPRTAAKIHAACSRTTASKALKAASAGAVQMRLRVTHTIAERVTIAHLTLSVTTSKISVRRTANQMNCLSSMSTQVSILELELLKLRNKT